MLIILGFVCGLGVNFISDVFPWKRRLTRPLCVKCYQEAYLQAEAAGKADEFTAPKGDFPWLNYFFWPRRCPARGHRRGWRVWIVEAIYILITLWLWGNYPEELGFWASLFWLVYLGIVVVIDLEYKQIFNLLSLLGAIAGLITGTFLYGLPKTLLGGVVGFVIMLVLFWLAGVFVKIIGRLRGQVIEEVALGFGDVTLSGVLGLFLGFPGVLGGLMLTVFIGGAISLIYLLIMTLLRRYRRFTALPYGPSLVMGAIIWYFLRGIIFGV
jgi:leader peptidase (prepilin peptidase)/N-methyltransferase